MEFYFKSLKSLSLFLYEYFGQAGHIPYLLTMTFSLFLLAHWIGDFGLQTSKMALGKCDSLKWLAYHVATYTGVLLVFSLFLMPLEDVLRFVSVNCLLHFITDFFTSKLAAKFHKNPRVFYPILGFDQLVHSSCLYWTFINSDVLAL